MNPFEDEMTSREATPDEIQQLIQLGDMEVQTDLVATPTALVGTCGNCKWWGGIIGTFWDGNPATNDKTHFMKTCVLTISHESNPDYCKDSAKHSLSYADTDDPSVSKESWLFTHGTFACNQWESKE